MSRLVLKICLTIVLITAAILPAEVTDIQIPEKTLQFYTDFTRFRYNDTLTYVEFPIELFRDQLQFIQDEEGFSAEYLVTAEVMDSDSVIAQKHWRNVDHCANPEEITQSQRLYNKNYFLLPEGQFAFRLEIEDPKSGRKGNVMHNLGIAPFTGTGLRVSDVQLANSIKRDSSNSIFIKNGYLVIPNPSALYGVGLPVLTGYSEIYNMAPAVSDSGHFFTVKYDILNKNGGLVRTQTQKKTKPGASAVNITQINVVSLVSGEYTLVMEVKDLENSAVTSTYRRFMVYRQADYEEGGALSEKEETSYIYGDTEIDGMTEPELDMEFEYARYMAAGADKKTFKKANLEGKREFLKRFWNQLTMMAQNLKEGENFRHDYLARVDMANQMFRGSFQEGWKTDRGRILLIYGKPDDIERTTFGMGTKSHEIWHYQSLQGGVRFVFVDKQELGDMELVHSTARGELYDSDWTRWLE